MAKLAVEVTASSPVTTIDSYDSTKWSLGSLIKQRKDLSPNFIGPMINTVGRPIEAPATTVPGIYPWVVQWDVSNGIDWLFLADCATANIFRRLQMWEMDRKTSTLTPRGYTTLYLTAGTGNHTTQGLRMSYEKYTVGQVCGSGQYVGGFSNNSVEPSLGWVKDRLCAGSRIGFGSSDPTQITSNNWYQIESIYADNSIKLTTPLLSPISSSVNYVIEDLRCIMYNTSSTVSSGGVFVAKGLSYFDFPNNSSTMCPSVGLQATHPIPSCDCSRAVYRLAAGYNIAISDVSAAGCGLEPKIDWQTQYLYGLNIAGATAGTAIRFYKYNLRAALTDLNSSTGGVSMLAIDSSTHHGAITATLSRTNNGRWGKLQHGPLQDVSAVYFVSTTKVYGVNTANLTPNASGFSISTMSEVPPGGAATFAATSVLANVEIASSLDRLVVSTTAASGVRGGYVTKFNTVGDPMDHIMLADLKQIDQSSRNPDATFFPNTLSVAQYPWVEGGLLYLSGLGTTAATNMIHTAPIGVEWTYASSTNTMGRLITPKMSTPNCAHYTRAYAIRDNMIGSDILGKRTDAIRLSYRTSGIDDNSGSWTLLTEPNDMSSVAGADYIQILVEFKGITDFCVPARVMVVGVVYEDLTTDSHFQPSVKNSNITNKQFAWRHSTAFGTDVPALKIILTNAETGVNILTDYTDVSTNGYWDKSIDTGSNWITYNSSDKTNENTYIRYNPTSLADNIKIKANLTLK